MNHRLDLIDRVAEAVHDERRRNSPHHCGPHIGSCSDCRDHAAFIVDEVLPVVDRHRQGVPA